MRLIDADDLLCRFRNNVLIDVTPEIEKQIEQQPTAFDKEKMIEELRKISCWKPTDIPGAKYIDDYCDSEVVDLDKAIEIVEKGGIE